MSKVITRNSLSMSGGRVARAWATASGGTPTAFANWGMRICGSGRGAGGIIPGGAPCGGPFDTMPSGGRGCGSGMLNTRSW